MLAFIHNFASDFCPCLSPLSFQFSRFSKSGGSARETFWESRSFKWIVVKGKSGSRAAKAESRISAHQLFARELEPIQIPQDRHSDLLAPEEFLRRLLQFLSRDRLNALDQFVKGVEALEIHFLAGKV